MGGRGSSGSGGGGGSAGRKQQGSTSKSNKGSAGSGGGKGKKGKGSGSKSTGGVQNTGGKGGSGGGSSTSVNEQQREHLDIDFGDGMTDAEKVTERHYFDQLPEHLKKVLHERGLRVYVGRRADQSPGWAEMAQASGWDSHSMTEDGRELGDLSFYIPNRNEIFISYGSPHGSANVYVHEMGHAIDYKYYSEPVTVEYDGKVRQIKVVSDDPEFRAMHRNYLLNNENVDEYYRTGSNGTAVSGRREAFAEGLAVYNRWGTAGLVKLFDSELAAQIFVRVLKRHGVIK